MADDSQIALAHYRLMFPTIVSLGSGKPPSNWKAEYDRVAASGLSATLITGNQYEGGSATAIRNFDQSVVMIALLTRLAELDSSYDETLFAPPKVQHRRRLGITVRLGH